MLLSEVVVPFKKRGQREAEKQLQTTMSQHREKQARREKHKEQTQSLKDHLAGYRKEQDVQKRRSQIKLVK